MKLTAVDGEIVHLCDFCGVSNSRQAGMFVSLLQQQNIAICQPCVAGAPFIIGRVTTTISRQRPDTTTPQAPL